MTPIMRVVLPIIGALIGWNLASPPTRLFDLAVGAAVGFAIAEVGILRARLDDLGAQVGRLIAELRPRHAAPPAPVQRPEPAPPPPDSSDSHESEVPLRSGPPVTARPSAPEGATELPIIGAIRGFLTGGNTLVRAGVIVLFFGVAFLLRYMAEHTHVPIEFRLSGISLGGVALLAFGWRLRTTRGGYALAVQGGGVGILYLAVFAALRLYAVIPAAMAFPILAAIAILTALLAVLQNSIAFAVLAVSGGFLAPVLASTGQGSHVVLFSYYAVLNSGRPGGR